MNGANYLRCRDSNMSLSFSNLPNGANEAIKPFTLQTSSETLHDLKTLIKLSKIAVPTFENSSQKDGKYGIDRKWMQRMVEKWTVFDWSKTEDHLNTFPHFKAAITDDDKTEYEIHFMALFSKKADAVPLIFLHGWPGCFLEFIPILQLLKGKYTPESLPYHIIIPSLPGYAFSSGPPLNRDFGIKDVARIFDRLMSMLGFDAGYIAQGGDIGSNVATLLAANHPSCKAFHVNCIFLPGPPASASKTEISPAQQAGLARGREFLTIGSSYALEHATKPSTIGLVLASSPLALMAWVSEKFRDWSDVTPADETIIEFVTLYWITNSIERCIYPYRGDYPEGAATLFKFLPPPSDPTTAPSTTTTDTPPHPEEPQTQTQYTMPSKPLGFSAFPLEILSTPRSWVEGAGNLVFYRAHTEGGHFAALEKPEVLLADVVEFVDQVWGGVSGAGG